MTSSRLRVLITNVTLTGRTGTEIVTRDLALGLLAAGHEPMVYAPALGPLADDLRTAGVPVASRLADLPATPDIIHGHHHVQTVSALLHFPATRALFVCHDRTASSSAPPRLDRIGHYVAVDRNCLERLVEDYAIPREHARIIPNAVDTARFRERPPLPPVPTRAAIFSNYAAEGTHVEVVQDACARAGLALDIIGAGANRSSDAPERDLLPYDIVFAKGRCALEAAAVGAAVVLCDVQGLGPLVTAADLDTLRAWNFGWRLLREPLTAEGVLGQIQRYDTADAEAVRTRLRAEATLEAAVAQYVEVYAQVLHAPARAARSQDADLAEYLQHVSDRIGQLERALRVQLATERMPALDTGDYAKLRVSVTVPVPSVRLGGIVRAYVLVSNGTRHAVGSYPPFPIHLSYRWLTPDGRPAVEHESARTSIAPHVPPGDTRHCVMRIAPPPSPGRYRLRVTFVQEGLQWLDQLERPVFADAAIVVSGDGTTTPA